MLRNENFNDILKFAEQGNAIAQSFVGWKYATGNGVTQDYHEAFKWYKKAAEQGHAAAQLMLAEMYYTGQGVATNHIEACKLATLSTIQTIRGNVRLWLHRQNVWLIVLFVIAWFILHNIWWGKILFYVLLGMTIFWVLGIGSFEMLIGLVIFYLSTLFVFIKRLIFGKSNQPNNRDSRP